ncbi:uncharacterized protein [Numenius arquata]|uniref:uncharacterized protein n=1 Tax=Numenius arquata TaxID=31919 RepID=UPI003D3056C8
MEPREEEEEEHVPPIATTPPHRGWKEESLSRSSSETQASATSGISLGEAIRQKTTINWGIESWYQLPAEVDASHLTAALETKLGLTCDRNDLTEFPTLEEGVLPSAEAPRKQSSGDTAHGLLLDIQDSQLSPCLPLVMYSAQSQRFSDETLLQQSEMDFIPLRGVPDVSGVSEERAKASHIHEAVSLTDAESPSDAPSDCFTLSQHPFSFRHVEPCDASGSGWLSQQTSFSGQLPVNKEANEDCKNYTNEKALIPQTSDDLANSTSKVMLTKANRLNQTEASLAKQTCSMSVKDQCFSRNSDVPATGFELSEEDKGLLRHDEFSSSENSSCKTVLTKNSEKREREMQKEKVKMSEGESEGCMKQLEKLEKEKKVHELDFSNNLSDDLRKDNCKNSDARDAFSAKTSEVAELSKERGVDLNGSESLKFVAVAEEIQGVFLDHQQKQLSPPMKSEKEEFISTVTSTSDCAPKQVVVTEMEAPSCSENAPVEVEPQRNCVAGSKAGGLRESEDSSSGDSLAARIKNLLRNSPSEPLGSVTGVTGGFQSILSKASVAGSKAGGMRESDDSSSGDSLAARVKNLRNGPPAIHAAQILKSADEEEMKARAWVKLKLASRSQESVSDWNEDDQQRLEEIKAELLLSAKKSALAKVQNR